MSLFELCIRRPVLASVLSLLVLVIGCISYTRLAVREYPKTASDGVAYAYNRNDGLHITLADEAGFDLAVLRGGAAGRLYVDDHRLVVGGLAQGGPAERAGVRQGDLIVAVGGQRVGTLKVTMRRPVERLSKTTERCGSRIGSLWTSSAKSRPRPWK